VVKKGSKVFALTASVIRHPAPAWSNTVSPSGARAAVLVIILDYIHWIINCVVCARRRPVTFLRNRRTVPRCFAAEFRVPLVLQNPGQPVDASSICGAV
jgi:hypothetical protein